MAEKKKNKQNVRENEPGSIKETEQAGKFRRASFAFGGVMFAFMLAGIIISIVLEKYIFILFVLLGVMCVNLIWFWLLYNHRKKAISVEIKKTTIVLRLVNGRTRTINKKNICAVRKNGDSLQFVLEGDEKISSTRQFEYVKCSADDISQKNFPGCEVVVR